MGRASLVAVLEVAGFPVFRVAGALFREESARLAGVIAVALATALLAASSALSRR